MSVFLISAEQQMECIGEVEAGFVPVNHLRHELPIADGHVASVSRRKGGQMSAGVGSKAARKTHSVSGCSASG
ncbi:MAG: hypothetical protein IPH76_14595 [Xanthomonadales bacterium]|nr:hypothetical protein [Xanthomonadales bacterium]